VDAADPVASAADTGMGDLEAVRGRWSGCGGREMRCASAQYGVAGP
jgi:hypothetical protein